MVNEVNLIPISFLFLSVINYKCFEVKNVGGLPSNQLSLVIFFLLLFLLVSSIFSIGGKLRVIIPCFCWVLRVKELKKARDTKFRERLEERA